MSSNIDEVRKIVEKRALEIYELSKKVLDEPDNDIFKLALIGYCSRVRLELSSLRNEVMSLN